MHLNLMAPMFPQLDVNIPEGWWKQDAQLDLDFANRRAYNKFTQFRGRPDSILTYTSPSPKMVYGDDGVLKYAPHNLILQSQTFDTATWTKQQTTVTANNTIAPDRTTTAAKVEVTGSGFAGFTQSITTTARNYTVSIYAKAGAGGGRWFRVSLDAAGAATYAAYFDLVNGVVGSKGASVTSTSMEDVGDGWYRCTYTITALAEAASLRIRFANADNDVNGTVGMVLYFWGAQVQLSPNHSNVYIPTTTTAVYSLPIDHDPITHAPLGVLIEEQRTNLQVQSQTIGGTGWSLISSCTATLNSAVAPDGTTTMSLLTGAGVSSRAQSSSPITVSAATSYTASVYMKAGSSTETRVAVYNAAVTVALATVSITWAGGVPSTSASVDASNIIYDDVGNGIYRLRFTFGTVAETSIVSLLYPDRFGVGANSYFWGAQLEAGAFPTSYIPTVASQVTRAADQVSILTSAFGYNAAAGTVVVAANPAQVSTSAYPASLDDGASNELIGIRIVSSRWRLYVRDNSVDQSNIDAGSAQASVMVAAAAAWAADDFAISRNGASALTDGTGTLPTVTKLNVGRVSAGDVLNGHIKRLTYFPTRKPDAELQGLTI